MSKKGKEEGVKLSPMLVVGVVILLLIAVVGAAIAPHHTGSPMTGEHLAIPLENSNLFGDAVMLDANVLAVSALDPSGYLHDRTLYVFEYGPSGWEEVQKISQEDIRSELFVRSVGYHTVVFPKFEFASLHKGRLFVAEGGTENLYLHIFEKRGGKWLHTETDSVQNIRSNTSDFRTTESYLQSMSFFDNTLALGFYDSFTYPTRDSVGGVTRPDNVYVINSVLLFEKGVEGWKQTYRIASHIDDTTEHAYIDVDDEPWHFGSATALQKNTLAVGNDVTPGTGPGSVFLFEKKGDVWKQSLKISNDDGGPGLLPVAIQNEENVVKFGGAVALSGNILAVGMPGYGDYTYTPEESHGNRGAVYLFERGVGGWKQVARIAHDSDTVPISLDPGDMFGASVALSGNLLAVGAPGDGEVAAGNYFGGCKKVSRGAVYLFKRGGRGRWSQVLKISDERDAKNVWHVVCDN